MRDRASTEDLITPCVALLGSLSLDQVRQDWVDTVWDGQFTETLELPADYEELIQGMELGKLFTRLTELISRWIKTHKNGPDEEAESSSDMNATSQSVDLYRVGFWTIMTEQNVKYKVLIALLYHFMEKGQDMFREQKERSLGLKAAGLYLVILGLPGSGAFKIFHPVLFSKALDSFTLVSKLKLNTGSESKKGKKSSQQSQTMSQASQRRQRNQSGEEEEEEVAMTQREAGHLVDSLVEVIDCLLLMLTTCSLKRSHESIETLIQHMVSLIRLERQFQFDLAQNRDRAGDVSSLALNAFLALMKLCSPLHGPGLGAIMLVLRSLLPGILMVGDGSSKELLVIRKNCIRFVIILMNHNGQVAHEAASVLVQHLATRVPDKADFRREAADAIVSIMSHMPGELYKDTVRWFARYCHSEKASNRLFSLEVVGRLMYSAAPVGNDQEDGELNPETSQNRQGEKEKESNQEDNNEERQAATPKQSLSTSFLFACIYGRCGDVSPSVRTQALKSLGDITTEQSQEVRQIISRIFSPDKADRGQVSITELLASEDTDLTNVDILPSGREIIQFLRKRALDQSVFVRKSALQVLENILKTSTSLMADDLVSVLAEHCRDPSLAVRKQMVISLTELVKTYPDNEALVKTWVDGVFPLILDVETKAVEKVLECVWECLFVNLVHVRKVSPGVREHQLPWIILKQVESCKMANYLSRACNTWAKEAKLNNTVLHNLQSYIGSEHNGSTWMLFGLITAHVPCKDPGMVMDYFNSSIVNPEGVGLYTLLQILKVLFASVSNLGEQDRTNLQSNLLSLVKKFKIPPELISISVDVITVVSGLQVDKENLKRYQSSVDGWTVPILDTIDTHLKSVLLESPSGDPVDEDLLCRQIFTLGELAQISPHRITRRMYLLLQSIIFQSPSNMTTMTTTIAPESVTIPSTQTQATEPPSIVFVPSEKLQAVVVVSLGKMCLQNEEQAKKIIPAFGQILDGSQDPAMKNNIMYALTDMCVRYASLVDPLIPQMTTCLKDKFLSVRRTTLILLINLLQEDYLKIRGNGKFFFRILHTLLDPSQEIQHLTTFYIQQRMLKRLPKIMYSNFVESIFHFNDFKEHGSFNKFIVSDKEKILFDLSGERKTEKRRTLYKFMLENMNDEQRFQTTYRLCQDVLGGVVEDNIKLTPASLPVLKDTFFVLASDAIKLASLKSKASDNDEPETDEDRANMVMNAAKKQIISGVVKKNVMENVIPIIIGLKHKLEAAKSPLISDLFQYLRKLMEDYKNEVTEILAEDKQLAKEIEFDLRRFEQDEQERREREQQERLRPVKSRTQSPASVRYSRAASPAAPGSASKTLRPGSTSASPRTPASAARKDRRRSLARQALENVMTKTVHKDKPHRVSVSDPDVTLGAKSMENEKDRTKSCPNVTTTGPTNHDDGKVKGSTDTIPNDDTETVHTSVSNKDKDSTLKSNEVEKENNQPQQLPEEMESEADSTLKNVENENEVEQDKPSEEADIIVQDNQKDKDSQEKNDKTIPTVEAATKKDDLDKSKRVSGQGMPRPRTPERKKKFHNIRAISTPQVNKTVMGDNVTFMSESVMDLSAITVLSPPSTINDPDSRRQTGTGARNKDDTDAVSFRFKKGGKDLFDNLVSESQPSSGETKNGKRKEISPLKEKNTHKKTRSVSSLESIEEDHPTSAGPDKADGREKRKLSLKSTKK